jgi:serine/threonine protein kinase
MNSVTGSPAILQTYTRAAPEPLPTSAPPARQSSLNIEEVPQLSTVDISQERHSAQALEAARSRVLQLVPQHVKGKMPRLMLGEHKQWYAIKDVLKRTFINVQWNQFLEGKNPKNDDTLNELRAALNTELEHSNIQSAGLQKKAQQYIEKKVSDLQFSLTQSGSFSTCTFSIKGTDLKSEVFRTQNGGFFQFVTQKDAGLLARIRAQQDKNYKGEVKVAKGAQGKIRLAEQLHENGSTVVTAKTSRDNITIVKNGKIGKANTVRPLVNEQQHYRSLPHSRHFSSVRDVAYIEHDKGRPKLYLFMDFHVRGDMFDILVKFQESNVLSPSIQETIQRTIAFQFIEAVNQMHNARIYHQDIKFENFLFSKDGAIVLTDFGTASTDNKVSNVRTREYMPPENGQEGSTKLGGDKYALGHALRQLSLLFPDANPQARYQLSVIANNLLTVDPNSRSSLEEILNFPYFDGQIYRDNELLVAIDNLPDLPRKTIWGRARNTAHIPEGAGPLELDRDVFDRTTSRTSVPSYPVGGAGPLELDLGESDGINSQTLNALRTSRMDYMLDISELDLNDPQIAPAAHQETAINR